MSRSKNYWFFYVLNCIRLYPDGLGDSVQAHIARLAIRQAIDETLRLPDGNDRVRIIEAQYIKKTHTRAGAAMIVHISERTAERWSNKFIRLVAAKMGFD